MLDRVALEKVGAPTCGASAGTDDTGKAVTSTQDIDVVWKIN